MTKENLIELITGFSNTGAGAFLNTFHWKEIQIKEMNFSIEGVVTAMYCALTDTLKVAPDRADDVFFGSVIHELRHAAQRHASGFLLYLLKKTFPVQSWKQRRRNQNLMQHNGQGKKE